MRQCSHSCPFTKPARRKKHLVLEGSLIIAELLLVHQILLVVDKVYELVQLASFEAFDHHVGDLVPHYYFIFSAEVMCDSLCYLVTIVNLWLDLNTPVFDHSDLSVVLGHTIVLSLINSF